jgi:hypothetical protein
MMPQSLPQVARRRSRGFLAVVACSDDQGEADALEQTINIASVAPAATVGGLVDAP